MRCSPAIRQVNSTFPDSSVSLVICRSMETAAPATGLPSITILIVCWTGSPPAEAITEAATPSAFISAWSGLANMRPSLLRSIDPPDITTAGQLVLRRKGDDDAVLFHSAQGGSPPRRSDSSDASSMPFSLPG